MVIFFLAPTLLYIKAVSASWLLMAVVTLIYLVVDIAIFTSVQEYFVEKFHG